MPKPEPAARLVIPAAGPPAPLPSRRRMLRVAHLTDIHVKPELGIPRGMEAALRHLADLPACRRPDFVINGGDAVFDTLDVSADRTKALWTLWNKVMADGCGLSVEHVIGNHDISGWNRAKSGATGAEPGYGKAWALEMYGLTQPYRSFERAGWKFVVLDSCMPGPAERGGPGFSYVPRLDEDQFAWLADELASTPAATPVCVVSHVPFLSAAALQFMQKGGDDDGWHVPAFLMHVDGRRATDLFARHPNVRVVLSGHLHMVDRVDFHHTVYLCDGSVCGDWWKGPFRQFEPGYALVDLFDDGSCEREYVDWGWKPAP